jgi:hypothetical protein
MIGRCLCASSHPSTRGRPRLLRSEALEPRTLLSGSGFSSLIMGSAPTGPAAIVGAGKAVSQAPTVQTPISINNGAAVTGQTAALSVLGIENGSQSNLSYRWSVTAPAGGSATFAYNSSTTANNTVATFSKAGTYTFTVTITDSSNASVSSSQSVVVLPTLTTLHISNTAGQPISSGASSTISGTSQQFSAQGLDQFGNAMSGPLSLVWSATSMPTGASTPSFTTNSSNVTTVTYKTAGSYGLGVRLASATTNVFTDSVLVSQTLTGVHISNASGQLVSSGASLTVSGVSQAFTAQGLDQFGNAMSGTPSLVWSATVLPGGASTPTFTTNGNVTTVTYGKAGSYALGVRLANTTSNVFTASVSVNQTLTSVRVSTASNQALTSGASFSVTTATQTFTALGWDQFGNAISGPLSLVWSATSLPTGAATPTITTTSSNVTTVTYKAAGAYSLGAYLANTTTKLFTASVSVNPTLTGVAVTVNGRSVSSGTSLTVSGVSQAFTVQGLDQFGNVLGGSPSLVWSATSLPTGAPTPTFTTNGNVTTVTYGKAGSYALGVRLANAASNVFTASVTVTQTASSVQICNVSGQPLTSGANFTVTTASQQFLAQGLDQFGNAMSGPLSLVWSATTSPAGAAAPTFATNSSNVTTVTYKAAGVYALGVKLANATSNVFTASVSVNPTLTGVCISNASGQPVSSGASLTVSGVSQAFTAQGCDQFGNVMSGTLSLVWSTLAMPCGVSAPTFTTNGNVTTVTYTAAGSYTLGLRLANATSYAFTASVSVNQTSTGIRISVGGQTVNSGASLTNSGLTQAFTVQGVDQFGNTMNGPSLVWSATAIPAGAATPSFSTSGSVTTVTYKATGSYTLSACLPNTTTSLFTASVSVTPAIGSIRFTTAGQQVSSGAYLTISTASEAFTVQGYDQAGNAISTPVALVWSAPSLPAYNSPTPTFTTNGNVTTVTYATAGSYTLSARLASSNACVFTASVWINQTLTSILVFPNVPSVLQGATQQLTPQALDQFGQVMANQQIFTWGSSAGSVNAAGMFTAPGTGSGCTVTVTSGSGTSKVTGTATVALLANPGQLQNATLSQLVQTLDKDGSISRADMMQILYAAAAAGTVSATTFTDLKEILYQAATLNIPGYVQVLAADVINGNMANATYQGQPLGNLAVGSSATQLDDLIGKWFLGTDNPVLCNTSLVYTATNGSLFPHTPSHLDEFQGMLGDCYLISSLGTIADSNPAAIQNMIINNGDGTYTVRFYTGMYGTTGYAADGGIGAGFVANSMVTADYVTVDCVFPASTTGVLAYANYGNLCSSTANALWIPLIEKAYAQWNATGNEGRDDTNSYCSIQGGWMATVYTQVLGHNASDYIMTNTQEQIAKNALAANKAVTIGTLCFNGVVDGLYGCHAYAIIGYNQSTDTFILYNPWGFDQPTSGITWARLQADCSQMATVNTLGSLAISGAPKVGAAGAAVSDAVPGRASALLGDLVDAVFAANASRTHGSAWANVG